MKAIKSDLLIDCTGAEPVKKAVVLIEGNKIQEVGRQDEVEIPSGTDIIELKNQTVLAGMIEPHQHILPVDRRTMHDKRDDPAEYHVLWGARELLEDLASGVTTVRLLGNFNWEETSLMRAIDVGVFAGPRIMTCGKALRTLPGHGYLGTPIEPGVDSVRKTIRENFAHGATCTKIFISQAYGKLPVFVNKKDPTSTFWSREEIEVAIDETHKVGAKIAAHAVKGEGVTWFVEADGDSVEHGTGLTDDQLDLMAEKGTYIDFTLAYDHPTLGAPWDQIQSAKTPAWASARAARHENTKKIVAKVRKKGIPWTTNQDVHFGLMPWLREYLVKEFNIPPMEAILSNTKVAAECCGIIDKVGTLEPGKYADLFSCKGNPLDDISTLQNIGFVMVNGKEFDCNTHHWKDEWDFELLWNTPDTGLRPW